MEMAASAGVSESATSFFGQAWLKIIIIIRDEHWWGWAHQAKMMELICHVLRESNGHSLQEHADCRFGLANVPQTGCNKACIRLISNFWEKNGVGLKKFNNEVTAKL